MSSASSSPEVGLAVPDIAVARAPHLGCRQRRRRRRRAARQVERRRIAGAAVDRALGGDEPGAAPAPGAGGDVAAEPSRGGPPRASKQRRAFTFLDDAGERTITVIGGRMVPHGDDPLLAAVGELDAVYFTAGDIDALRRSRGSGPGCNAASAADASGGRCAAGRAGLQRHRSGERYEPGMIDYLPRVVLRTLAAAGGEWLDHAGNNWALDRIPAPGPAVDTLWLRRLICRRADPRPGRAGLALPAALELGARCGAACLTGRGPYAGQLTAG